jgi:hypothetical protein
VIKYFAGFGEICTKIQYVETFGKVPYTLGNNAYAVNIRFYALKYQIGQNCSSCCSNHLQT